MIMMMLLKILIEEVIYSMVIKDLWKHLHVKTINKHKRHSEHGTYSGHPISSGFDICEEWQREGQFYKNMWKSTSKYFWYLKE